MMRAPPARAPPTAVFGDAGSVGSYLSPGSPQGIAVFSNSTVGPRASEVVFSFVGRWGPRRRMGWAGVGRNNASLRVPGGHLAATAAPCGQQRHREPCKAC
jgi:hypothetical protein